MDDYLKIAIPSLVGDGSRADAATNEADFAQAQTNYYNDNYDRGTMCCGCDKA